jgi:hypothetical protein
MMTINSPNETQDDDTLLVGSKASIEVAHKILLNFLTTIHPTRSTLRICSLGNYIWCLRSCSEIELICHIDSQLIFFRTSVHEMSQPNVDGQAAKHSCQYRIFTTMMRCNAQMSQSGNEGKICLFNRSLIYFMQAKLSNVLQAKANFQSKLESFILQAFEIRKELSYIASDPRSSIRRQIKLKARTSSSEQNVFSLYYEKPMRGKKEDFM